MRELMRELVLKRPTDEWRRRMERMHTALDLSERDNARLRVELSKIASRGGADAADAAASALSRGAMHEDLFRRHRPLPEP